MANREIYPSSLFPLRGDVRAEAGATSVEVIGLANVPFDFNSPVRINGLTVSLDYAILVDTALVINYGSDDFLGIRLNGVLI